MAGEVPLHIAHYSLRYAASSDAPDTTYQSQQGRASGTKGNRDKGQQGHWAPATETKGNRNEGARLQDGSRSHRHSAATHAANDKAKHVRQMSQQTGIRLNTKGKHLAKTMGSRLAYWQSKKARGGKQGRLWKSAALLAAAPGLAEVPSVSLPW